MITINKIFDNMEKRLSKKKPEEIAKTDFSRLFNQSYRELLKKENVEEN